MAVDYYINNLSSEPSIIKVAQQFEIAKSALSRRLHELNIPVINYQNRTKFDETIFDNIDTEEKAYWLGFIFADGYISSAPVNSDKKARYCFELSLKGSDVEHLRKFAKFVKHESVETVVRINDVHCGNVICQRCRICLINKHLWETLNKLGCVPNKSLILEFPDLKIFKSSDLIKHFIRGYWDGDGCLTWANVEHTRPHMSLLGTYKFLQQLCMQLPQHKIYAMQNHSKEYRNTYQFSVNGKTALNLSKYLYENSTISLDRKYQKYLQYCRLYEESYKKSGINIGEDCDVNPEISLVFKETEPSYSVETEPEESE